MIHNCGSENGDGGVVVKAEQVAANGTSSTDATEGPLALMVTAADPLTGELLAGRLAERDVTAQQVPLADVIEGSGSGAFDAVVVVPPNSLLEYIEHGWNDALRAIDPLVALIVLAQPNVPVRALIGGRRSRAGLALLDSTTATTLPSILASIRFSVAGRHTIDPVFTEFGDHSLTSLFSPAERAVFELLAVGFSNQAIAEQLFLSERTVETHIRQIFLRLGLTADSSTNRRVVAARLALDGTASVLSTRSRQ